MKEVIGSHRTYYKLRGKFNAESCVSVPVNLRQNICVNMLRRQMFHISRLSENVALINLINLVRWEFPLPPSEVVSH